MKYNYEVKIVCRERKEQACACANGERTTGEEKMNGSSKKKPRRGGSQKIDLTAGPEKVCKASLSRDWKIIYGKKKSGVKTGKVCFSGVGERIASEIAHLESRKKRWRGTSGGAGYYQKARRIQKQYRNRRGQTLRRRSIAGHLDGKR